MNDPKALLEKVFEELWVCCIFSLVANIWICRCLATPNIYSLANPPIHYHYLGWSNVFDYRTWICIFTSEFYIYIYIYIFIYILPNFSLLKFLSFQEKNKWRKQNYMKSIIFFWAKLYPILGSEFFFFFSYVSQVDRQRECFCCLFFFLILSRFCMLHINIGTLVMSNSG